MATQVKHRRGNSVELETFTPAIGELIMNIDTNELILGDGVTQGGHVVNPKLVASVAVMKTRRLKSGEVVFTKNYATLGDNAGATYLIKTASQAATDGDVIDGYGNHTLVNGNVAILQVAEAIDIRTYGVTGTGDETVKLQAAVATGRDVNITIDMGVSVDLSSPSIAGGVNDTFFPWQNTNYCAVELTNADQKVFGSGKLTMLSVASGVTSGYNAFFLVREVGGSHFEGLELFTNSSVTLRSTTGFLVVGDNDYTNGTRLQNCTIEGITFDGDGVSGANSSAMCIILNHKRVRVKGNHIKDCGVVCAAHFCNDVKVIDNNCGDILELIDFDKAVVGFEVAGNEIHTTKGGGDALIELNGSQDGSIHDNIVIRDAAYDGRGILVAGKDSFGDQTMPIQFQQPHDVTIYSNIIKGCEDGIFTPDSKTDPYNITIRDNIISDIQVGDGVAIRIHGEDIKVIDNQIYDCDLGIVKAEGKPLRYFDVSGNVIKDVAGSAIALEGDDDPVARDLTQGVVSRNVITDCGNDTDGGTGTTQPMYVREPVDLAITGNNIKTSTLHGLRAVSTTGGALYNTLSGNIVRGATSTEFRIPATISANLAEAANVGTIA